MRAFLLVSVALLALTAQAAPHAPFLASLSAAPAHHVNNSSMLHMVRSTALRTVDLNAKQLSLCGPCVEFTVEALNILLNAILNIGVVGGCSKICSFLEGTERTICNIACDAVGIDEFIKIIEKEDLDPIYFCELIKACPEGPDNAAGKIDSVGATPPSFEAGTQVTLGMEFTIINATGAGEISLSVEGGMIQTGQGFVNSGLSPGKQEFKATLNTQDDPSAEPPVEWLPGNYTVHFALCQGECGSKHPHSIVLDEASTQFTIVP